MNLLIGILKNKQLEKIYSHGGLIVCLTSFDEAAHVTVWTCVNGTIVNKEEPTLSQ